MDEAIIVVNCEGMMIRPEQMIPILLDHCPGFKPTWDEHVTYWDGKPAGIYNYLAEFVHYLVTAYEQGQTSVVQTAFEVLERFLEDGDSAVQEYAVLGIIETLQNVASHKTYGAQIFVPFLGERSIKEWKALDEGWATDSQQS